MIYKEVQANLFDYYDKGYYVAQCLSADLVAGAGIAVEFNNRLNMKNKLLNNFPHKGYVYFTNSDGTGAEVFIPTALIQDRVFNLITKERVWERPTYQDLTIALNFMRLKIIEMLKEGNSDVNKIALPLIGCGIDGLEWKTVRKAIKEVFGDMDIEIVVCYLERDKDKVIKNDAE